MWQVSRLISLPAEYFPRDALRRSSRSRQALKRISKDPGATIVVGGVDTFFDLRRISVLDSESRILCPSVMDGFIPGEGAAFLVLKDANRSQAATPHMRVLVQGASLIRRPQPSIWNRARVEARGSPMPWKSYEPNYPLGKLKLQVLLQASTERTSRPSCGELQGYATAISLPPIW